MKTLSAFIAALAFAIHPLQVEPIAWCMGRKDVLSTLLSLICMQSYITYSVKPRLRWIIVTFLSGIMAMLAKPVMIILPGVLLLIEFFLLDSIHGKIPGINFSSIREFIGSFLTRWTRSREEHPSDTSFTIRKTLIILLSCYSLLTVYFNLTGPFRVVSNRTPGENLLCVGFLFSGWIKRFFMVEYKNRVSYHLIRFSIFKIICEFRESKQFIIPVLGYPEHCRLFTGHSFV